MPKKPLPPETLEFFRKEGARGGKLGAKRVLEVMTPEDRTARAKKAAAKSAEVRTKKGSGQKAGREDDFLEVKLTLLCGIPASGKSTYGRWLEATEGWLFLDVEEPGQLERVGLEATWNQLFKSEWLPFLNAIEKLARPAVLAWGFPPAYLHVIAMLKDSGVSIWWLDGDRDAARQAFIARGSLPIEVFEAQMFRIQEMWTDISAIFTNRVIHSVCPGLRYLPPRDLLRHITNFDQELQGGNRRDNIVQTSSLHDRIPSPPSERVVRPEAPGSAERSD